MSETSVLNDLVGEGKKFATVEDLAKGKLESDNFIAKIQNENKELRELVTGLGTEVEKLKTKASFVDKLNVKKDGDQTPANSSQSTDTTQSKVLSEEDVSKIILQREDQRRAEANQATVDAALVKQFGAEAKKFVADRAAELGLGVEQLIDVAKKSPAAFYNLVGMTPNGSSSGSLSNLKSSSHSGSSGNNGNGNPEFRGAKWWEAKRKAEGAWKFATNKELNVQMHKDMRDLGDKWNDY